MRLIEVCQQDRQERMMKMQYTEEQIVRANQTDLVSFLNAQGEQLFEKWQRISLEKA